MLPRRRFPRGVDAAHLSSSRVHSFESVHKRMRMQGRHPHPMSPKPHAYVIDVSRVHTKHTRTSKIGESCLRDCKLQFLFPCSVEHTFFAHLLRARQLDVFEAAIPQHLLELHPDAAAQRAHRLEGRDVEVARGKHHRRKRIQPRRAHKGAVPAARVPAASRARAQGSEPAACASSLTGIGPASVQMFIPRYWSVH